MLKPKLMKKQKTKTKYSISGLGLMLMMVFFTLSSLDSQAQEKVSGVVKDGAGLTLPGVNVAQKGSKKGVITDIDGNFTIVLSPGVKTLVFSSIGYENIEIGIGNKKTINVTMKESTTTLDDVVIIGYQKVQREKVLGSVSNVKAESIEKAAPVDLLQGIQGKIAGVQVTSNNGPGEGFDIKIRGIGSLNGSSGPLYVVDGQQTFNIDNLNPNDIESFEVLKDGATTAAYGAQGANGVVIITSKSGKRGELNVGVSVVSGMSQLVGAVPVSNAKQRISMERTLDPDRRNINRLDSLSLGFRNSPDNQDLISRPALRQQLNVTLSGGSEKSKFYWNTGFLDQEGVVLNSDFKRISTRLKLDLNPSKNFSAGVVANLTFEETNGISSGAVLGNTLLRIPYIPIYEPNGDLAPTPNGYNGSANPVQQLLLRETLRKNYTFNVFNYAEIKIIPQLSFKATLGVKMGYDKREGFAPKELLVGGGIAPGQQASANESHNLTTGLQQDDFLNYNQKWGDHSLSAFAGIQIQTARTEILSVSTNLANNLIQTMNNADLNFFIPVTTGGQATENYDLTQFSSFAGLNYDYASKYLIGATIRRDGSSRFGSENQTGIFPSGSLGWRVNKEGFLKNVKSINNLLLRASYGVVGNDRIGRFEYLSALEPQGYYDLVVGFVPTSFGNTNIKWEETASTNFGLDLGMFKRRLNVTLDFWQRDTKDLLINTQLPEESGFATARENRGLIRNKGIDFSIDGTIIKKKDFTWNGSFNIGVLDNEVIELDTPIITGVSIVEQGQPIGNFFRFKQNGIFQYDESNAYLTTGDRLNPNFDANGFFLGTYNKSNGQAYDAATDGPIRQLVHAASGNVLKGGDYIWDDKNNDGKIDTDDTQKLGNGLATVYGGFTQDFKYKNFTLGMLFDYSFGNDIYRRYDHDRNSFRAGTITPSPDRIDQAWTNQGDIATYPLIASAGNRPQNRFDFANNTANNLYIDDGSFIKWRYIRAGYTFAKEDLDRFKIGLKSFAINLQVNNIITWTNYQGYNPEFGNRDNVLQPSTDNLRYPSERELLLSLNLQF